jgi:hypothetical protein
MIETTAQVHVSSGTCFSFVLTKSSVGPPLHESARHRSFASLRPPARRIEKAGRQERHRHYASKLQASSVFDDRGTGRIGSKQSIGLIDVKVETPQFLPARTVDNFEQCRWHSTT